jgi:hypothetical protein
VTRARNLEEDLVLALELDLLVVDAARQEDQPVNVEELGLGERDGGAGGAGRFPSSSSTRCHAEN